MGNDPMTTKTPDQIAAEKFPPLGMISELENGVDWNREHREKCLAALKEYGDQSHVD